tara:strand:- start:796 stop:1026 length:231 start_codon:yes stop_codon:yes gene_type:complete
MRKTIEVSKLLAWANSQLARTDSRATTEWKAGVCTIIEQALFHTGNYQGFGFIDNSNSETGTLGYYSRFYYVSKKL